MITVSITIDRESVVRVVIVPSTSYSNNGTGYYRWLLPLAITAGCYRWLLPLAITDSFVVDNHLYHLRLY